MKCLQTKFHVDTLNKSKVNRSKEVKIYQIKISSSTLFSVIFNWWHNSSSWAVAVSILVAN